MQGVVAIVTKDTVLRCQVPVNASVGQNGKLVACGADVPTGCIIMYSFKASEGCSYSVYDKNDNCLTDCDFNSTDSSMTCGGGFVVTSEMSYIVFSTNTSLYRTVDITVAALIDGATSVTAVHSRLDAYCIDERYRQDIVDIYLDTTGTGGASIMDYPHGAIYLSTESTHPSELFGGSWQDLVGVFPTSVYAWARVKQDLVKAVCGTILCGQVVCGQ